MGFLAPGYDAVFRPAFILHSMAEGGAAGGITAGLLGARAYVMGYSTILALPIIGIAAALVVAALVTFLLGFTDIPAVGDGNAFDTENK